MSVYTNWINLIKEKADEDWLTDSQRQVYEGISSRWRSAQFVNLHGPDGGGKTFIARLLAKKHGYAYVHELEHAPHNAKNVILDNAQYTRMMRPLARSMGLERVVLITNKPLREAMPEIGLRLNEKDVRQFQAALAKHCDIVFQETIPEGLNLAEIIHKEVTKRGESHVHQRP